MNKMIKTRFAPSPTGDPHIGNIRTALFEYLFAKKNDGEFLLRIEDTDRERHEENSIEVIKEALRWLDIVPENIDNPVVQSTRLDEYKKAAFRLIEEGNAYVCNCSKERLEEVRAKQQANNEPTGYDKHCRDLNLKFEDGCVVRMKVPEGRKIKFQDLIRGEIQFDSETIDDQIILKSDGFPTYHLAHVVDDALMEITHVIRGEEWLPSTPKHILLNEMLGFPQANYAHLPVILAPDKGKLSKRHGAVRILEYKQMGYLPEALINFMVLLGWNPKNDQEFFTLAELETEFDIANVNKSGAVFNIDKLNHINRHYLMHKSANELKPLLDQEIINQLPQENLDRIIDIAKQRMTVLIDFKDNVEIFMTEVRLDKDKLVFKKSTPEITKTSLDKVIEKLSNISDWTQDVIKQELESVVSENSLGNGDVFWPTRYALSGQEKSAPPEEIAEALGKDETLARINSATALLS